MKDFIKHQSTGEIIRTAGYIYVRHFGAFFSIYFLPIIPFAILVNYAAQSQEKQLLFKIATSLDLLITLAVFPAITVAMSHICLGSVPRLTTSYKRMRSRIGGFLITYLHLVVVALPFMFVPVLSSIVFKLYFDWEPNRYLLIAILLLAVSPFVIGFMFALQVAALEPIFGAKALKRSIALGKGHYLRNFFAFFVLFVILFMVVMAAHLLGTALNLGVLLYTGVITVLIHLLVPLCFIGLVLLYWDMRVRKEAYDSAVLAEELRD